MASGELMEEDHGNVAETKDEIGLSTGENDIVIEHGMANYLDDLPAKTMKGKVED